MAASTRSTNSSQASLLVNPEELLVTAKRAPELRTLTCACRDLSIVIFGRCSGGLPPAALGLLNEFLGFAALLANFAAELFN